MGFQGLEGDLEMDLEGQLEGDSKGDFRGDFKQDMEGNLLSSSSQVWFSLQPKFNSFELDSEVGWLVLTLHPRVCPNCHGVQLCYVTCGSPPILFILSRTSSQSSQSDSWSLYSEIFDSDCHFLILSLSWLHPWLRFTPQHTPSSFLSLSKSLGRVWAAQGRVMYARLAYVHNFESKTTCT